MARELIPTVFIVLTVVRDGDRFLVVHEKKHDGWYLPAGRVDPGETLEAAALRETLEESGVTAVLEGIVRIEHTPVPGGARLRVVYVARPAPGSTPHATEDSLDARFATLDELRTLPLRGVDVLRYTEHVARGGRVLPLDAIVREPGL